MCDVVIVITINEMLQQIWLFIRETICKPKLINHNDNVEACGDDNNNNNDDVTDAKNGGNMSQQNVACLSCHLHVLSQHLFV